MTICRLVAYNDLDLRLGLYSLARLANVGRRILLYRRRNKTGLFDVFSFCFSVDPPDPAASNSRRKNYLISDVSVDPVIQISLPGVI